MPRAESEQAHVPHDAEVWLMEAPETQERPAALNAAASNLTARLLGLVLHADWLQSALHTSRDVLTGFAAHGVSQEKNAWCIAAGAVRSVVWNHLHGFALTAPAEIDLVHFSPDAPEALDAEIAEALARCLPLVRWDVVNQVYAHRFSSASDATPFPSLEHAMACWPETATAVGVSMTASGELHVVAPHGLTDLFALVLRRSPLLRDPEVFEQRRVAKGFCERWPRLRVV